MDREAQPEPHSNCPNVLPGAQCVDPDCTYCRIARDEQPKEQKQCP